MTPELPPEAITTVAKVAAPLVAPAGHVVADVVTGLAERALRPLRLRVHEWRKVDQRLFVEVDERLASRGVTEPSTPDPAVAFGVLLGTRCTNDELHGLFAELMTTAMDPNTSERAHPAFADILRQLVPDEARLLTGLAAWGGRFTLKAATAWEPKVTLPNRSLMPINDIPEGAKISTAGSYVPALALRDATRLPVYITNLSRLGLLSQRLRTWVTTEEMTQFERIAQKVKAGEDLEAHAPLDQIPDISGLFASNEAATWALTRGQFAPSQYPGWLLTPSEQRPMPEQQPRNFILELLEASPFGLQFIRACIGRSIPSAAKIVHSG